MPLCFFLMVLFSQVSLKVELLESMKEVDSKLEMEAEVFQAVREDFAKRYSDLAQALQVCPPCLFTCGDQQLIYCLL